MVKIKSNLGMTEIIKCDTPSINNIENIYIEKICDDYNGLCILVADESKFKKIQIKFDYFYGYRNFNESERLKTLYTHAEFSRSGIYKTQNSPFANWLTKESLGIVKSDQVWHYVIITPEDIFEVLTPEPPVIQVA